MSHRSEQPRHRPHGRGCEYNQSYKFTIYFESDRSGVDEIWKVALSSAVAVEQGASYAVSSYQLSQNYPNPFNPSTTIEYSLKRSANVMVEIHNVLGQKVRRYGLGKQMNGSHEVTWDGRDDNGVHAPSGVYFYRLKAGDYTQTKKMLLLK